MNLLDARQVILAEAEQIALRQETVLGKRNQPLLGVSFSGGGIRSASFNLGIVQGLAASGLLRRVDYLSTVSGGGYIGSWLHGVIKRYGDGKPGGDDLKRLLTRPESSPHLHPAQDPIQFIRQHTSYLAPDIGLFSPDFWVVLGIYFRNMLLNQTILLPFLALVSLLPLFLGSLAGWYSNQNSKFPGELLFAGIAMAALVYRAGKGVGSVALADTADPNDRWDSTGNAIQCALLMLFTALGLALASDNLSGDWLTLGSNGKGELTIAALCLTVSLMFGIMQWKGRFAASFKSRHGKNPRVGLWLYPLLAGSATGLLLFGLMGVLVESDAKFAGIWNTVGWGPPILSAAMLVGGSIHIGLMGVDYGDHAREWLARMAGYSLLFSLAWAGLFFLSIFGPLLLTRLAVESWVPVAGIGGGWVVTSIAGALVGSSPNTDGSAESRTATPARGAAFRKLVIGVAPTAFVVGYMLLLSLCLHQTVVRLAGLQADPSVFAVRSAPGTPEVVIGALRAENALLAERAVRVEASDLHDFAPQIRAIAAIMLACGLLVWYLPRRIDVNEFSMHHFYKNRLVRSYLGATNGEKRNPSRLTGFDPRDDIPLSEFIPEKQYFGPYPLLNGCLNLTHGADLATSERRGSSFLFSPLHAGYDAPAGYRPMRGFGYPDGFSIGTCLGISGAAASPNGGASTSAPMSFLMTVFCVRLGWWVGNTRMEACSAKPGPGNSLLALLAELFAYTNADFPYLNISDGGHFENLGLYELVRRRCRFIIAGDGEQDREYTFEGLGGAVRKCRVDFGADIAIDPRPIQPAGGVGTRHCVVGRISYALRPGDAQRETGWLLYLKSSLTGDEPKDVAQFKASHPDFPQESTANQFFTESQFESYRKLGLHVWESAFEGIDLGSALTDTEKLFSDLEKRWA